MGKSAYLHKEIALIHYWLASACMLHGMAWQVVSQKNNRPVQVVQGPIRLNRGFQVGSPVVGSLPSYMEWG